MMFEYRSVFLKLRDYITYFGADMFITYVIGSLCFDYWLVFLKIAQFMCIAYILGVLTQNGRICVWLIVSYTKYDRLYVMLVAFCISALTLMYGLLFVKMTDHVRVLTIS